MTPVTKKTVETDPLSTCTLRDNAMAAYETVFAQSAVRVITPPLRKLDIRSSDHLPSHSAGSLRQATGKDSVSCSSGFPCWFSSFLDSGCCPCWQVVRWAVVFSMAVPIFPGCPSAAARRADNRNPKLSSMTGPARNRRVLRVCELIDFRPEEAKHESPGQRPGFGIGWYRKP